MEYQVKVWDLPTRVFHWTLVAAVCFMWLSAEIGGSWMAWHLRCGLLILGLLVFRLCWGIWGSDTARFSQFVRSPAQIKRYLCGEISENEQLGHNPLGALMVVALIGAVLFQVFTGLFAADDNTWLYNGYLSGLISEHAAIVARRVHMVFFNFLAILIVVHIAAVMFYKKMKGRDLITPMITGVKSVFEQRPTFYFAGVGRFAAAFALALAVVLLVVKIG